MHLYYVLLAENGEPEFYLFWHHLLPHHSCPFVVQDFCTKICFWRQSCEVRERGHVSGWLTSSCDGIAIWVIPCLFTAVVGLSMDILGPGSHWWNSSFSCVRSNCIIQKSAGLKDFLHMGQSQFGGGGQCLEALLLFYRSAFISTQFVKWKC